jgi:hypothetical protein
MRGSPVAKFDDLVMVKESPQAGLDAERPGFPPTKGKYHLQRKGEDGYLHGREVEFTGEPQSVPGLVTGEIPERDAGLYAWCEPCREAAPEDLVEDRQ